MTATHWRLPYRAYAGKVPATEQDRREAMVETIVAEYIETDDEVTFEQLLVIRPDLEWSELCDKVEHLDGLSVKASRCEEQCSREAFNDAVEEYVGALYMFARIPVAVTT